MKKNRNDLEEKGTSSNELPDALKVILGTFHEKNPDTKLEVKEVKKAED